MSLVVSPIFIRSIVSESGSGCEADFFSEIEDRRVLDFGVCFVACCQSRSSSSVILIGLDLFWRRTGVVDWFVNWMRPFLIWVT